MHIYYMYMIVYGEREREREHDQFSKRAFLTLPFLELHVTLTLQPQVGDQHKHVAGAASGRAVVLRHCGHQHVYPVSESRPSGM